MRHPSPDPKAAGMSRAGWLSAKAVADAGLADCMPQEAAAMQSWWSLAARLSWRTRQVHERDWIKPLFWGGGGTVLRPEAEAHQQV